MTNYLAKKFDEEKLPLSAYSWRESAQNVIALGASKKSGIAAIMSVVLLIGMVGIINNAILSALENIRDRNDESTWDEGMGNCVCLYGRGNWYRHSGWL